VPPTLADRVRPILQAVQDIEALLARTDRSTFASDRFIRLAIERALEIISEASRHIPADLKQTETRIAWRRMADLGNRLRHAYHRVDADILWEVVNDDLPPLKEFVNRIIREGGAGEGGPSR
jgi:uncharacterized protein with HEPN domain